MKSLSPLLLLAVFFSLSPLSAQTSYVRGAAAAPPTNILAVGDYSPYGERSQSAAASLLTLAQAPAGVTLRQRFTGQEDQSPDFGVPYTDFGARQYNVSLRRWMVPDPMGESYYDISPYVYCAGDPMRYLDPEGRSNTVFS